MPTLQYHTNKPDQPDTLSPEARRAMAEFERVLDSAPLPARPKKTPVPAPAPAHKVPQTNSENPWLVLGGLLLAGAAISSALTPSSSPLFRPVTAATTHDLGSSIRNRRKDLGLTQVQLAELAGVGTRCVLDLERGKETSEMGKALMVLDALDLQVKLIHRV